MTFTPNQDDWNFIQEQDAYLPHLAQNFRDALDINPQNRLDWAQAKQYEIYRDGWFTNAPITIISAETVGQHVESVITLSKQHIKDANVSHICNMLSVHDITEAIAHVILPTQGRDLRRDINHYKEYDGGYKIDKETKHRIESLAANIIFESAPAERTLWDEFETNASHEAKRAQSMDKIHPLFICLDYVEMGYVSSDFKIYWDVWSNKVEAEETDEFSINLYNKTLKPRKRELERAVSASKLSL